MTLSEFSLPLSTPLSTAAGTIESRDGLLVRLDGGIGEATPLPGWTEPLDACRSALDAVTEPLVPGNEETALDALGGTPAARHGLELAMLDREARRADEPLSRHLAGEDIGRSVPVNATVGDAGVEATVTAAAAAVRSGFTCVKVKVGARSVAEDGERLAAVRDAVGPHVELRADANAAWSREAADRAVDALAATGVSYVEQPLAADDLEGHAALRGGPVGVALDESLAVRGPAAVIDADAADVLVVKPMALGGVRRAREVALQARSAGAEPVVTTTVDGVIARTAAVHLAASLAPLPPCGLATADRLAADLGPDPATVEDGSISVPDDPGIGVTVE